MAKIIKRMGHQDQQYGCDNRIHDRLYNQQKYGDPETEARKGQIAVTEDNYLLIPDILENYDSVEKSSHRNNQGKEVVRYIKEYPDGTIYYLEEIRIGRKSLAFKTMYKKEKGNGSSGGLMHEAPTVTSATTPDNPISEGKDSENIIDIQENGGENEGKLSIGENAGEGVGVEGVEKSQRFIDYESQQESVGELGGLEKNDAAERVLSESLRGALHGIC